MKKAPAFVPNSKDNMHCVNAVFRMVHRYYFGSDLSWREIDRITHAVRGKAIWTFVGETWLAKKRLSVSAIEQVDYKKLSAEGPAYLTKVVGKKNATYYLEKSNIASVIRYIPEYLKYVHTENRAATVEDIITFLKAGNLVGAEINPNILNHKKGFDLHLVLIYGFDRGHFLLHDPGLPPRPARRVPVAEFEKSFSYRGAGRGIDIFGKPD